MSNPSGPIPGWIVDLADAVSSLRKEQLMVLGASCGCHDSAQSLSPLQLQRSLTLSTTDAVYLAQSIKRIMAIPGVTSHDIGVVLATLAQTKSMTAKGDERVEVVCTAPSRLGVPVRTTFATALEMVRTAHHEIFVVGYVFTEGARDLVEQFAIARRDRGVRIALIGNRLQNQLAMLQSIWPPDSPPPDIFSRQADSSDLMTALHAKILICDRAVALVTSANFSHHGLHENVEMGVRVKASAVVRMVEFLQTMIEAREVVPMHWLPQKGWKGVKSALDSL